MIPSSPSAAEQLCRRFPLAEIKLATADFSDEHLIGRGGFGKVYKGVVDNGSTTVAVKRLASNSNQGEREFVTEIETLSKLRHHNLVSLMWMTMWALEKIRNGKANKIAAVDLRDEISEDCLKTFVRIAKRCLDLDPKKRLTMSQVVAQLEFALEQQERRGPPRSTQKEAGDCERIPKETEEQDNVHSIEDEQTINMKTSIFKPIALDELKYITNDFSLNRKITYEFDEECIFHGVLRSGQNVAIKKLDKQLAEHEFLAQVSKMVNLKHENIVTLHGYCIESGVQALAYEFASRGSLHNILYGKHLLSWAQTIEIAVGAARGLHYIHEKALIHHHDETAKITNIHPSTDLPCTLALRDESALFSDVRHAGCVYHPPECSRRFRTSKSDVYCFGLVLLELLIGDKFYDRRRAADDVEMLLSGINNDTLEKIKDARLKGIYPPKVTLTGLSEDNVVYIVDARLNGDYPSKAVAKMAEVAALCLRNKSFLRPSMSDVLKSLNDASQETRFFHLKQQFFNDKPLIIEIVTHTRFLIGEN